MAKIFDLQGNVKGETKLPGVFSTEYRPDLIRRAVLAVQSHSRQPYGADPLAGKRTSAHYHGVRKGPHHMMNREMSRLPRTHGGAPWFEMRARFTPHAVKGRRAHPPLVTKIWDLKINQKEKRLAVMSALAATQRSELIASRHRVSQMSFPIIIADEIEDIKKSAELEKIIGALKLASDIERAKEKKLRPGKGKMRGRRYKRKKSILFIISKNNGLLNAAKNLPGVDVCNVSNINIELLAPGTHAGRLTIFDESAVKKLGEMYG